MFSYATQIKLEGAEEEERKARKKQCICKVACPHGLMSVRREIAKSIQRLVRQGD